MLLILSLAFVSILALSIVRPQLNPGLLALCAVFLAFPFLPAEQSISIARLFPVSLFLTLLGVTFFFACLNSTGLIDATLKRILRIIPPEPKRVATVLFVIVALLTGSGVGNIACVALMAPLAISLADEIKISKLAMTILVVGAANAASFSPLCLPGIIINESLNKIPPTNAGGDLLDARWKIFWGVFVAISVTTWISYLLLSKRNSPSSSLSAEDEFKKNILKENPPLMFTRPQKKAALIFVSLISLFIAAHIILNLQNQFLLFKKFSYIAKHFSDIALLSWIGAGLMLVLNVCQPDAAFKKTPWPTLIMVCGMSTLIELLTRLGFAQWLAQQMQQNIPELLLPATFAGSAAFLSAFSSSVGVALPTFLPLAEAVSQNSLQGIFLPLLLAIAVGSHLVDASPLSTLGALCLAQIKEEEMRLSVYKGLLIFSLLMIPFAAILALFLTMIS